MGIIEIIGAVLLILACIFIIVVVYLQDSKKGMSQTLMGGSSENYYQKNSGRTRDAKLARWTRTAAIIFFVCALVVNFVAVRFGGKTSNEPSNTTSVTTEASVITDGTTLEEQENADSTTSAES